MDKRNAPSIAYLLGRVTGKIGLYLRGGTKGPVKTPEFARQSPLANNGLLQAAYQPPSQEPGVRTITEEQVRELARYARDLGLVILLTERRRRKCRARHRKARGSLSYLVVAGSFRQVTTACFGWRFAAPLIMGTALGALFFTSSVSWKIGVLGFLLGIIAPLFPLYYPSTERAARDAEKLRTELAAACAEERILTERVAGLRESRSLVLTRLERWSELLSRKEYLESTQYRRQQLLKRDWRALRGVPFEDFLGEAFRELGYDVATTKTTGDQGADLIVSRDGKRIAVQAKGYAGTVSNSAVQEVYAAKGYYDCHVCAAITNSRFTSGAKRLARRVGCALIDEDSLPALVLGRIDL